MMAETIDGLVGASDVAPLTESSEVLMVETTEGFNSKAENQSESAYPQPGESLSDFQEKCRVNGSKALLCPKCSAVFDEKTTKKLKADNKALKEEKLVVLRFVFDKHGEPRRNEEYRRKFQHPRPKTFIPPTHSTRKVDRVRHPKRGQKTKVESVGERDSISKEEKGLCGIF